MSTVPLWEMTSYVEAPYGCGGNLDLGGPPIGIADRSLFVEIADEGPVEPPKRGEHIRHKIG